MEEEWKRYITSEEYLKDIPGGLPVARHFANWQKQQLIKFSTDSYIRRNNYTKKNVLNGLDVTCEAIQNFKNGEKLKVCFIKED